MISSFRMNIKERSARMEKYAKVIVKNNSQYTDNLFTYKVPEFLQDEICLGHRVLVPFGKGNKPIEAYVFKIIDNNDEDIKTKYIYDILDERPILKRQDLELIHWMKNRYLCTYMDCINLIIPKGYKLNNYKSINDSSFILYKRLFKLSVTFLFRVFLSFIPYSSLSSATAVEYSIFLSTSLSSFIFPLLSNTL